MPNLPPPLAAYFAVGGDADALAACFTPDAVVHDERQDHRGVDAIKAWREAVMARTPFTARPLSLREQDGKLIVPTEVSGAFPGSPITLDHCFTMRGDRIVAMEIH